MQKPILPDDLEKTGDAAMDIYSMVYSSGYSREWGKKQLETCKIGNVARAIFCMVRACSRDPIYLGNTTEGYDETIHEWGEKQLETCQYGDVSEAIYNMVEHCGSSREWAEKQLETCQHGDVAGHIKLMVDKHGSSPEWANKVLISKGINPKY